MSDTKLQKEITLLDYVLLIIKHRRLVLLVPLLVVLTVMMISLLRSPIYEARQVFKLIKMAPEYNGLSDNYLVMGGTLSINDVAVLAQDKARSLSIKSSYKISADNQLTVIVLGRDSESAKKNLSEISDYLIAQSQSYFDRKNSELTQRRTQLENTLQDLNSEIARINQGINQLGGTFSQGNSSALGYYLLRLTGLESRRTDTQDKINDIQLLQLRLGMESVGEILVAREPFGYGLKKNLLLAFVFGLLLGVVLVFIVEWWQNNYQAILNVIRRR